MALDPSDPAEACAAQLETRQNRSRKSLVDPPEDEHGSNDQAGQPAPDVDSQVRDGKDHCRELKDDNLKHAGWSQ